MTVQRAASMLTALYCRLLEEGLSEVVATDIMHVIHKHEPTLSMLRSQKDAVIPVFAADIAAAYNATEGTLSEIGADLRTTMVLGAALHLYREEEQEVGY
jgi:hypothetical protein